MANDPQSFVALTPADCMLRALDHEARLYHGASHISQLVLRLGPGFDAEQLRLTIERLAQETPIVRAPIHRRFGIGAPIYDLAGAPRRPLPRLRVVELPAADPGEPPQQFLAALNEPMAIERGELLRFDVARYGGGTATDVAISWVHMLLDGAGSEGFVRSLDALWRGANDTAAFSCGADDTGATAPLRERGRRASTWQRHVHGFARHPPASLAGPLRRVGQQLRYRVQTFAADETRRIAVNAKRLAGFLTPALFYMAAVIRAHHELFRARGAVPQSYVIPLPVNLRPKGAEGAVFRTHVSLLWFQILAPLAEDFDALLAELKRQRHESIRGGQVESGAAAMEFARLMPKRLFGRMVRGTLSGELCSFFFAFTGDFLGRLDSFLGAPIVNGYHVPAVPPSPGSCAALSLRAGRLNLTHVYQQGVVGDDELVAFANTMRRELLRGADLSDLSDSSDLSDLSDLSDKSDLSDDPFET
jgi:hypothetical protein